MQQLVLFNLGLSNKMQISKLHKLYENVSVNVAVCDLNVSVSDVSRRICGMP